MVWMRGAGSVRKISVMGKSKSSETKAPSPWQTNSDVEGAQASKGQPCIQGSVVSEVRWEVLRSTQSLEASIRWAQMIRCACSLFDTS